MDILALTSTEAVRATIGVDDTEFNDSRFTERNIADELEIDLYSWLPLWVTLIADDSNDAVIERQKKALKNYAKYFVSVRAFSAANQAFLQSKSDGEVESKRYNQKNLENQRIELKRLQDLSQSMVLELTTSYTPTETGKKYTQFVRAKANRDVITE